MRSENYLNRISKVQKNLKEWDVDGCLIENPTDLFYLTGMQLSSGILLVFPQKVTLFVDGRYSGWAKKHAPVGVALLDQFPSNKTLAFDSQKTTVDRAKSLKGNLKPIPQLLKQIRSIKDGDELKKLQKSGKLLWKGYQYIRRKLKEGISEKELALEFEIFCLKNGAEKLAFDPIIAFGENSAYPHYRAGKIRLKKGDIVLLDLGIVVDHYHSDMTRTVFFGKPDSRLLLLDAVVRKAHGAALKICKPGTKIGDLDLAARKVIEKAGLQNLIQHSLGHGIGLETHEYPRIKYQGEDGSAQLEEHMVITIEPGLYMPGVGGVRYEDTLMITRTGYNNFYAKKN